MNEIYKIKESVDLFLTDNKYIMAYFINTRKRKNFSVNEEMIHLLENIDGEKSIEDLFRIMNLKYKINKESLIKVIETLNKNKIITKVLNKNDILCEEDLIRFSRQINFFSDFFENEEEAISAQKKIIDSDIVIFGSGSIGGTIAIQLAMAGVRNITIYDFDVVEISDLSRHIFFKEKYIGLKKNEALKKEIELIDPKIKVKIVNGIMNPKTDIEKYIKDKTFVINTLDEPYIGYTSSKISRVCIKYNIPHYIAGGFDAHLASTGEIIVPGKTPCVECYANYFKIKLKNWKPQKHPVKIRYNEIGGLSSMTLFSSSFACVEIIKFIAGLNDGDYEMKVRGELLFKDYSLTYIGTQKDPECKICCGKEV